MDDFNQSRDSLANDAKQAGQEAVSKAKGMASDASDIAEDVADTGRAYAKDAVNATGKKIDSAKSQLLQTTEYLTKAIHAEPVKAVLIAAAVSSALTALVIVAARSDERYY